MCCTLVVEFETATYFNTCYIRFDSRTAASAAMQTLVNHMLMTADNEMSVTCILENPIMFPVVRQNGGR